MAWGEAIALSRRECVLPIPVEEFEASQVVSEMQRVLLILRDSRTYS